MILGLGVAAGRLAEILLVNAVDAAARFIERQPARSFDANAIIALDADDGLAADPDHLSLGRGKPEFRGD